jgi:two-component system, cell cycle sensor histidine kinase and response regulator CckA
MANTPRFTPVSPRRRRSRAPVNTGRFMPPSLDLSDVLMAVVRSAAEITGAAVVTAWTSNEETRTLHRQAVSDEEFAAGFPVASQPYTSGGAGWVATHRRALNIRSVADDDRLIAKQWMRDHGLTSFLGLPIAFEGSLLGVLALLGRTPFKLGPGERRRLEAFIVQAAAAIRNARHFAASEARRRSAEALADVARVITQGLDPDLVAARIAESVQTLVNARTAAVYLRDAQSGRLTLLAQARRPHLDFEWVPTFAPGEGVVGHAIRGRSTTITGDLASDPRITYLPADRARLERAPYRSVLAVPLLAGDRVFGALAVGDLPGRAFTREETELAEAFAAQAVVALDNARLYEEARRRQHEAETLAWVAKNLTESLDVTDVGQRIVESVVVVFHARGAGLRLLRPDGSLESIARITASGADKAPGDVLPPGVGITGRAVADDRAVRTPHLLDEPTLVIAPDIREQALASGELALLAVPLHLKGRIIGALAVADGEGREFVDAEVRLLQGFADQAALALENARLYGEARARERETAVVAELVAAMSTSLDLARVLQSVTESAKDLSGSDIARVALIDPDDDGDAMLFRYRVGTRYEAYDSFRIQRGRGMGGIVWETGRPLRTLNRELDTAISRDYLDLVRAEGIVSSVVVPIFIDERVRGLIYVDMRSPRTYTEHDEHVLVRLAQHAAAAIRNAELYGEAERRRREAELLAALARTVNESLDIAVVLQRIAAAVQELCRSDIARIALRDQTTGHMVFRYWVGDAPGNWRTLVVEEGKGVGGHVMTTGRPARTPQYVNDPGFSQDYAALAIEQGLAGMMCVPITITGRVEGLLFAINRAARRFTDHDEAVVVRLADQAGVAIHNAHLFTREQGARADAEASERALSHSEAELRASEERYRALVEHAPDAIIVFDPVAQRFVDVNEQAVRLSGLTRAELLEQRPLHMCPAIQPNGRTTATAGREWIVKTLRGEKPTFEWACLDHDGHAFPCEVSLVSLPDRGRTLIRASIFDISERKRAEETRARLQEELRQAQKMEAVGRLAGGVAHDFNNLLTVISGRATLVSERLHAGDPVRRDVDLIQKTTERAAALTHQLLAFSRKQFMQPKVLDLNTIVTGMEHMLRRLIGEDIEVITDLAPDLELVQADPAQLDQVIMNLAVNARDAMAAGGRLTISTYNAEIDVVASERSAVPPGAYVVLSVADSGVGMDAKTLERAFEPFFTTKEVGRGTGLGLSTVYGIVTQSGGHIAIESEPGAGALFTIYLPRAQAREAPTAPPVPADQPSRGRETILLVEDEPEVRELAAEILSKHGYRVLDSDTPSRAQQLCREHPGQIHLLLTDVVMPEMSGRTLAERLLVERPAMRVLYTSGYDDEAIVKHGMLEPGIILLPKPFTPAALTEKVRAVLNAEDADTPTKPGL